MKARPILFSAPMIRALLTGTKTQTRRIVKPQPTHVDEGGDRGAVIGRWAGHVHSLCQYGQPGDLLMVKETHQYAGFTEDGYPWIRYAADGRRRLLESIPEEWSEKLEDIWSALSVEENYNIDKTAADRRWRPSIHMPRWASRLTLRITDVRLQRLQEISYEDACAEGCEWKAAQPAEESPELGETFMECSRRLRWPQRSYSQLWDSINGAGSWAENPWVWAITFEVIKRNVDDVLRDAA